MQRKEYHLRRYEKGDEEEIVQLLELAFQGWPGYYTSCSSLDHWRWKYQDNPLSPALVVVGVDGDRIVGCNHGYLVRTKIGNTERLAQVGEDMAVHPDYRGLGMSNELEKAKDQLKSESHVDLTYWFTLNPILIARQRKQNTPRFPHTLLSYVRINDVAEHLRNEGGKNYWRKRYGYAFLKHLSGLRERIRPRMPSEWSESGGNIRKISSFDARIDQFWNEIKAKYDFIVDRSRLRLNWRYCDARGADYIVNQAEREGKIQGFSVIEIDRSKPYYVQGHIVDLLTYPDRIDVADALLSDAVRFFEDNGVNIVRSWAFRGQKSETLLTRHGFFDSRTEMYLYSRSLTLGTELQDLGRLPADRLHFQPGDLHMI